MKQDMTTSPGTVAPDTPLDEMVERVSANGFIIVEHAAPELTRQALAELKPHIEASPYGNTEFLGSRTKSLGGLLRRSPAAQQLVIHPTVLGLADRLLLKYCARYQLNFSGVMHLEPGAESQPLHRDDVLYPFLHPHPPTLMPAMWALTDFTADNGSTQLVAGSHMWEDGRKPFADEIACAEMPAGSVLVYLGGTMHGGGSNQSGAARTGMALQYSLGWLRQEENQYLVNPPEVARNYPERLQRLIGYDYGGPYLGFVEGGDPHRVLEAMPGESASRSTPELDAAHARVEWQRWGNIEAVPTPVRSGAPAASVSRNPDE